MDVDVRAFGPMEVSRGGAEVHITSRRQQVLLAMLMIRRGGVVSAPVLAEALWPTQPPTRVGKSLQIHVHRLRRSLGDPGAVRHRPPGYALSLPQAGVDLYRFEDLGQRGRAVLVAGDWAAAAELLRQAAALYRGPAFQGLDDVDELATESGRLESLRLAMLEDRITADLELGAQAALVAELEALVAEHPLRERFRAQLMTALYRVGRKADALATYRHGRRILAEELGVDPDPECQALERAILADDPSLRWPPGTQPSTVTPAMVPRHLPADVPAFTGRRAQLRRLDAELGGRPNRPRGTGAVLLLHGTAGVGKTALAVQWAHRVVDRFPDGQLYANLRGYAAGTPLEPGQVLTRFLRALGVPADQIPADLDETAAAYRSQLADRAVLVLLDNAGSADQVRPLLPGGGRCAALVTSRDRLAGLVAREGAVRVGLDVLPAGEARALLAGTIGHDQVAAEPAATADLAELCGRLPLALRIAAANLAGRPGHPIEDYVAQLRGGDRLAALAVGGDEQAAVAAAFDLSYHRLPQRTRRVFRRLGLVPGPDVTAEAVAALANISPEQCRRELAALAAAHLVEEHQSGRYACHDLLRVYARERASAEETEPARSAARSRLHDYYVARVSAANDVLYPHALRLPRPTSATALHESHPDPTTAAHWLDAELPNLIAAARSAAGANGPAAWLLADALRSHLLQRGHIGDGEVLAMAGQTAAEAAGDRLAYGAALLHRAGLRFRKGDGRGAIDDLTRSLAAFQERGWVEGQAAALTNLGSVRSQLGHLPQAAGYYTQAQAVYQQLGSQIGQAAVIGNLGVVLLELGRLREAVESLGQAVTGLAELGSGQVEGLNLGTLGEVQRLLGEFGLARQSFAEAQARFRATRDRDGEASMLIGLASVHCDIGQPGPARELAEAALQVAQQTEHIGHEAEALATLARLHRRYGGSGPAAAAGRRALELARQTGDRYLEAEMLVGQAALPAPAEGADSGRARVDQALMIARTAGFRLLEALALARSAALWLAAGEPVRASVEGERALAIQQEIGHRLGQARSHQLLSQARRLAGDPDIATDHRYRARDLLAELGVSTPR